VTAAVNYVRTSGALYYRRDYTHAVLESEALEVMLGVRVKVDQERDEARSRLECG